MLCTNDNVDGCMGYDNNGGLEIIYLVHCTNQKNPRQSCSLDER